MPTSLEAKLAVVPGCSSYLTDILVLTFENFTLARQITGICEPDLGEGGYAPPCFFFSFLSNSVTASIQKS